MTRLQADLLLLVVAITWGLAFVFQKTAMDAVGPMTFIAARSFVGTLALLPLAIRETRTQASTISANFWRLTALGGAALFGGEAMQQYGMVTATATNAGFLTALYVVCVPFLLWIFSGTPPPAVVWLAATLSFTGTWLLGGGAAGSLSPGDRLIAAGAVVWAVHVIVTGKAATDNRPMLFTCLQFALVTLVSVIVAAATETVTLDALQRAWLEIAYLGLASSAFTFTILIMAMRHAPPAEAAIIVSMENLFAALFSALVLGERLSLLSWSGAALIVLATLLVQLAPQRRIRQQH
jgi:drug/metabolite transporter (DMT)-like permease